MKSNLFIAVVIFTLLLSACNLPTTGSGGEDQGLVFTQAAETLTQVSLDAQVTQPVQTEPPQPSPTNTEIPTNTPLATSTNTPLPCNAVSFVADVTIPDNTQITVNNNFTKTWKLKNVGTCTWTSGYEIIFDSGDQMGGPASQSLTAGTVAPGQTVDVSVNLTAPNNPGTYKGNWKLREPGGVVFALSNGAFWVQIQAVAVGSSGDYGTYKVGDSGPEVYAIQHLLKARGYVLDADGQFGPITRAKVIEFQTDKGLTADGIVGPQTWHALIIQASQGKTGQEVRAVQRLLKDKFGFNTLAVDGIFGPDTDAAVKSFQTSHGLTVDGIVGQQTWKALISN